MNEPQDRFQSTPLKYRSEASFWLGCVGLILAILVSSWSMKSSFDGNWEREPWLGRNGARYSLIARNYQRIDWRDTALAPVVSAGAPELAPRDYYLHHPPLMPLSLGATFALFGESENVARRTMGFFTWLQILGLFALAASVYGWIIGGAASLCLAVIPFTGVYGCHVDVQGPQVIALLLWSLFFLHRFVNTGKKRWWRFSLLVYFFALLSDWPAYYLGALIPILAIYHPRGTVPRRVAWSYLLLGFLSFVLTRWQAQYVGAERGGFGNSLEVRTFAFFRGLAQWTPAFREALSGWVSQATTLIPWPMLLLASYGLISQRRRRDVIWAMTLLVVGLIHLLLFPAGALVHDYWLFALIPGFALFMALGAEALVLLAKSTHPRLGPAFALALAGLLFLVATWLMRAEVERRNGVEGPRDRRHAYLGKVLQGITDIEDQVLTNAPYNPHDGQSLTFPQFSYYADRRVLGGVDELVDFHQFMADDQATPSSYAGFLWIPPEIFPGLIDPTGSQEVLKQLEAHARPLSLEGGIYYFAFTP